MTATAARAPVRSPARRRASLRRMGADKQMDSGSYGILYTADVAHPLHQRLREEQRKVYEVLVSRADNKTRVAEVGYKKIADISGLPRRSVRRAIKELVSLGLIERRPRWGKPANGGGRACQLATAYYLPRLDELRPEILLAPLADLRVDQTPAEVPAAADDEDEVDEDEALQAAAQDLVGELAEKVREAQKGLLLLEEGLVDLGERVGRMFVGRTIDTLIREAEDRRVVEAVAAGRAPPETPFQDNLRTRLEAVGGASPRKDRNRFRHAASFEEALRARARWSDACYAVLGAQSACTEALDQVDYEDPRGGDWRKTVADCRVAVYLRLRAGELAESVEALLAKAETNWGPLPKPPAPPSPLRTAKSSAPDLRRWDVRAQGPWKPPEAWRARNGDSPGRWNVGRQSFEQAQATGNTKLLTRLREAGFREDWPDPPT